MKKKQLNKDLSVSPDVKKMKNMKIDNDFKVCGADIMAAG